jgi:O-antigen/teichoic acid export membrane protein
MRLVSSSVPRATLFSVGERVAAFVLQFGASVVIARLLSPAEVGVFSLAASLVAIAQVLRHFGIGDFLVQERTLDRELLRAAHGLALLVAWLIAAALWAGADTVARLYREPALAPVLQILAFAFVLAPVGAACATLLERELAWGRLAAVQIASTIAAVSTTIALAATGHSTASLAWGAVAGNMTTIAGYGLMRPRDMLLRPRLGELRRLLRFCSTMTASYLIEQLAARAPDLLIPRSLGFTALGLFGRGQSLALAAHDVVVTGFVRVARPLFARGDREPAALRRTYLGFLERLAALPLALFLFTALFADALVRLLFGAAWAGCGPVLAVLATGLALAIPWYLAPALLTGTGQAGAMLRIALVRLGATVAAVLIGMQIGLLAVALLIAAAGLLHVAAYQRALRRSTGLELRDLLGACRPSLRAVLPALAAAASARLLPLEDGWDALRMLALGFSILAVCAIGLAARLGHPLRADIARLLARRTPAPTAPTPGARP